MSFKKRGRRNIGFEVLSDRLALSAIPITGGGADVAGEGETATVSQQGEVLSVVGSDNDDVIEVELGDVMHKLTVNGETTEYGVDDVTEIIVTGDGGSDTVSVLGTDASESVEVRDGKLELKSDTYLVSVSLAENVTASAASGSDRALIFDTAGDDQLELRSDSATFVDSNAIEFEVIGFDRVMSFASNGGTDAAKFFDTSEDDTFIGKEAFSFMIGAGYWNYARGFDHVEVFQESGGNDTAWLYGSSGDDVLNATPDDVSLTLESGATLASHNFATTRALAGTGNDTATLVGEIDTPDRLTWDPSSAQLTTTRSDSVVTNVASGFEVVNVTGSDDADSAELRGSDSDDTFIALPEVAELTTPTASVMVHDFRFVVAQGNGGSDFAHLEDSAFNDNYLGKPNFVYLSGHDYLNLATGFETIDVAMTNGGYDFSTTQFATTIYSFNPFLVADGHFELTSAPGAIVSAFTQFDLDNDRVIYVHDADAASENGSVSVDLRIRNDTEFDTTGSLIFSATPGETIAITSNLISGPITDVAGPFLTNFFVEDGATHWIFGETRNERIFGTSGARAIGPGNVELELFVYDRLVRRNRDTRVSMPSSWLAEIATRAETPVPNYDLVDGELVKVGDAIVNPPVTTT